MKTQSQLLFKKDAIKYLERLPTDLQDRIFHELDRLILGFHDNLDIKIMEPKNEWYYRLRIGKLRVIFQKIGSDYQILTIWPRWDVYK